MLLAAAASVAAVFAAVMPLANALMLLPGSVVIVMLSAAVGFCVRTAPRIPLPAVLVRLPDESIVISPLPLWKTAMSLPLAADTDRVPVTVTAMLAGFASVPPDALKLIASPLVVVTLPGPVIVKVPPVVAVAATVP